ncbi:Phosphoribosylamine--glycine ligase [Trypanosoma grayi]|uniref:Phosphoribosylamine--glycine ligase n=1 Tax=Trypanosoma grayi TaxID=71804 RepID=UPI0004F41A85|nr:Phosphoribosylamine--glycine ligase [Trypanosoma grayi]KEG14550.1 Phosphoribosylamine--glycine ligase [Trypanosoma grayi]
MEAPPETQQQQHAHALLQMFGCSAKVAHRIVAQYWPDTEGSERELRRRQQPCLLALEVLLEQKDYLCHLGRSILPINETTLPCFRKELLSEPSSGYPSLTWGQVQQTINSGPGIEIFFINSASGIAEDPVVYEEFYQNRIVAEGFADIVGFITSLDGLAPLVDYLHARHFGGLQPPPLRSSSQWRKCAKGEISVSLKAGEVFAVTTAPKEAALQTLKRRVRVLFGNDVLTSKSKRQDKSGMQLALKEKGLTYIRGQSGHDVTKLKQWQREQGIPFPVVLKPVSGAGSEFVTLCRNEADLDVAFAVCRDVKTTQQTDASHMLLQEYVEGQEYVVNVVSYQGKHVVSDVWKSWKYPLEVYCTRLLPAAEENLTRAFFSRIRDRPPSPVNTTALLYDRLEFVHNLSELPEDSEERRVVAYTLQCVDALDMRQGCSHCEVRVDGRPGSNSFGMPILIELNARMLGAAPRATPLVGYNQYTLLMYLALCAASILEEEWGDESGGHCDTDVSGESEEEKKKKRCMLPWPPVPLLYRSFTTGITRHVIFFRAAEDSYVCAPGVRGIKALQTFRNFSRDTIYNEKQKASTLLYVRKTMDLLSSPGACVLEGSDADIRRDTAYIRRVENKDLSEWKVPLDAALAATQGSLNTNAQPRHTTEAGMSSAAIKQMEAFLRTEPPLFVSVEYVEKLKLLGLLHLVCGHGGGATATANS